MSWGQSTEGEAAAPRQAARLSSDNCFSFRWGWKSGAEIKLKSVWMHLDGCIPSAWQLPCPVPGVSGTSLLKLE